MSVKDEQLQFKLGKTVFGIKAADRFQRDEVHAVLSYLAGSEIIDIQAVNTFMEDACCIDIYRPCYAMLVPKIIRGKYRVYLHLTIEGKEKPKHDKYGNPRHKYGKLLRLKIHSKVDIAVFEFAVCDNSTIQHKFKNCYFYLKEKQKNLYLELAVAPAIWYNLKKTLE